MNYLLARIVLHHLVIRHEIPSLCSLHFSPFSPPFSIHLFSSNPNIIHRYPKFTSKSMLLSKVPLHSLAQNTFPLLHSILFNPYPSISILSFKLRLECDIRSESFLKSPPNQHQVYRTCPIIILFPSFLSNHHRRF